MTLVRLVLEYLSYVVSVASILYWAWWGLRRFGSGRTVSRFFQSQQVKIYFPLRRHPENRMVIANEDFLAALELSNFLRSYGLNVNFEELQPAGNREFDAGSVVICGPKSSEAVTWLYASDPQYVVEERGGAWLIRECATNNYLQSPIDREPREPKDIAYIGRRTNTQRKRFLLIGGVHAAGSLGAVRYIANYRNIRLLLAQAGDAAFSMVVRAGFNPDRLGDTQVEILLPAQSHS